jgi:hypothetical protein
LSSIGTLFFRIPVGGCLEWLFGGVLVRSIEVRPDFLRFARGLERSVSVLLLVGSLGDVLRRSVFGRRVKFGRFVDQLCGRTEVL